jgi:hypothetical protein
MVRLNVEICCNKYIHNRVKIMERDKRLISLCYGHREQDRDAGRQTTNCRMAGVIRSRLKPKPQ